MKGTPGEIATPRPEPQLTIIIPTRADPSRRSEIARALRSTIEQLNLDLTVLVVVNGSKCDAAMLECLESRPHTQVLRMDEEGLPESLMAGLAFVETEFVGTLDDDDEFVPESLPVLINHLRDHPDLDAVIGNGVCRGLGGDRLHWRQPELIGADPLREIGRQGGMLPGTWVGRTSRVQGVIGNGMPRYRECTFIYMALVSCLKIAISPEPVIVWHGETEVSESKSRGYVLGGAEATKSLLAIPLPDDVRLKVRGWVAGHYVEAARMHLVEGSYMESVRAYGCALGSYRGFRHWRFAGELATHMCKRWRGGAR